ncbi:LysE family translocator [Asticcacaulis sp. AC402]|uniref:LysE family translocator n=1 Tax=Asticcacaulis sp. AC402 TaxID=1282361 RepID=UPI0003C3E283|nr:LysE family translocator [Asticcacaulis sp. AC402]ESQ75849.1 lysine transporter LysE [Asticcacaulis sp. AC402]
MSAVDPAKYYAFLVAMALMAVSPGPANLFFIRTGLSGRKRNVFAGVAGVNAATLVWFIAAAMGLQALMLTFPLAFQIMTILGGLYLGWLGFSTALHALKPDDERVDPRFLAAPEASAMSSTLRDGFVVQMLNPKVLLFFSVVLPPFLDIGRPMPAQMSVFAATAIGMDILSMTTYGLLALTLSRVVQQPRNRRLFDIGAGAVLVAIAVLILGHGVWDMLQT